LNSVQFKLFKVIVKYNHNYYVHVFKLRREMLKGGFHITDNTLNYSKLVLFLINVNIQYKG